MPSLRAYINNHEKTYVMDVLRIQRALQFCVLLDKRKLTGNPPFMSFRVSGAFPVGAKIVAAPASTRRGLVHEQST